ncbi:MAG: phytoene/squalene synthase family protein [Bacteroidetes bacterium]|nr:phytoene/squalene synthase family protein [Bacteroidota bacterium]
MLELYNQTCRQCSRMVTQAYSTSFSLGIKSLAPKYRQPVYSIYAFVRFADEIVDTFHHADKAALLQKFREDTFQAIHQGISLNPVLHAFQVVVHRYHIDYALIDAFLESMEMDLHFHSYQSDGYNKYIYGSAEVVGLMCLWVFVDGNAADFESLQSPARKLGAAFQKVNFLRDIKDDVEERGRVYFPGVDFDRFDLSAKQAIEADIARDFDDAYTGIVRLPHGCRRGVYLAYIYYRRLFSKIKGLKPEVIKQKRVRVANSKKLYLLMKSYVQYQLNAL